MKNAIISIVKKYKADKTRLLDIFWDIQDSFSYISMDALVILSGPLNLSLPELKDTLSFYHFFHDKPAGKSKIYLDTSAIAEISGLHEVVKAFEKELNCRLGEVDPSGEFGLYATSCIGMSDQLPAALVAGVPVGNLNPVKIKKLVAKLKSGKRPPLQVKNTVHLAGKVLLAKFKPAVSLKNLPTLKAQDLVDILIESGLRGRGGAGFSTGKKWQLCAAQKKQKRFVVCNADEGEPGTFKDRYLLSEMPQLVFEGMIIAARAIVAQEGLFYLRAEYRYLKNPLEQTLQTMRKNNLLGKNILGIDGFDFDIRIQLGAGAYVVGEETALLESLEGKRGEPRVRPPFPVEEGYLGYPTIVNNVETLANVAKIMQNGAQWYRGFGTATSPGTKLLSVSGDCPKTGIYEVEWGLSIGEFLQMVAAKKTQFIQVGGPSGVCLNAREKQRCLSFEDLPTGGSMMIFNQQRDVLKIMKNFVQFFVNESCGCCLPCRAGNIVLNEQMDLILSGEAAVIDLERIKEWSQIISPSSRCGLGQTCTNPMLTSMQAFPELYTKRVKEHESLYRPFDLKCKTAAYDEFVRLNEEKS